MTTTQNKTDINAMGSCESEDEWVHTDEVDGLSASPPATKRIKKKHSRRGSAKLPKHPPTTMTTTQNKTDTNAMGSCGSEDEQTCNDEVGGLSASPPAAKRIKTKHSRRVSAKLPLTICGYLPTVLINPCRPAVKRIKTEYNRRVSVIRCSIPGAYHKIKNLNYEIRKVTAPAEISRVRSELNKNHAIILRAQCQMRAAHQEKKTKLEHVKTHAVFRYLTSKEKRAAKVAKFHQWSPSSSTVFYYSATTLYK